jgi:hypothetical protein
VHEDFAHSPGTWDTGQVFVSSATRFDATEKKVVTEPSPLTCGSVAYRGLRERVFADLTASL